MQKPVLVAGGCSFTDPNNWQYFSKSHGVNEIKAWPQVLADIIKDKHGIDYKVINTGRGGASLSKSIDRIQRAVFSEERNIKPHPENLIVLGLTDWWREYSTHTEIDFNPAVHYMYQLKDSIEKGEHPLVSLPRHISNNPEDQERALRDCERMGIENFARDWLPNYYVWGEYRKRRIHYAFQQIYNVITMAKALGYKVLIYQLLYPLPPHEHYLERFGLENPLKQSMDAWLIDHMHEVFLYDVLKKEESIIGFPFVKVLGGYNYEASINYQNEKYCIAPNDGHPNQLGHELIAKEFYNAWKNTE